MQCQGHFMTTSCFIVRKQRVLERQAIDLFELFGLILGVANLHSFGCFAVVTFELTMLELIAQHRKAETRPCNCCQGFFLTRREESQRFGFDPEPSEELQ